MLLAGIKLRNGLDLTVACPPSPDDQKRGCKKLPLFAIFQRFFPESRLAKDKTIDHTEWFVGTLTSQQVRERAACLFLQGGTVVVCQFRTTSVWPGGQTRAS